MQYQYITTNSALESCKKQLEGVNSFALDLEFDKNRYAYGFNLCLLQIYTGKTCFLIDPLLEKLEIAPLFPYFENPEIQKVVFAFGEDLRLLHSLGCFPKNIFDIAIAAKLLNYAPGSLAAILDAVLQIQINKSSQKSNWLKRPLTEEQLDYAALDVLHLLHLRKAIEKQAREESKLEWIIEENAAFDSVSYAGVENNNYIKKKDQNGLSEFEWHLYKEMMAFREKVAEKSGRPSYQVFDKELIKELALSPGKIHQWGGRNGNYKAFQFHGFKKELRSIIQEAESLRLSKTDPAKKSLSREEAIQNRIQRTKREKQKNEFFKPIQKEIISEYGEHAATLILGNRIITMILAGEADQLKPYQLALIKEQGRKLGLDLSPFFAS